MNSNSYNVVMVGNSSVGKTSFMTRVQNGRFSSDLPSSVGKKEGRKERRKEGKKERKQDFVICTHSTVLHPGSNGDWVSCSWAHDPSGDLNRQTSGYKTKNFPLRNKLPRCSFFVPLW